MDVILYIHGKDGSAAEAEHYKQLFSSCDVIGLAYKEFTPWKQEWKYMLLLQN